MVNPNNELTIEQERQRQAAFLSKHQSLYDQLIKALGECAERDDVKELSLHIAYIGKIIECALNMRLIIQQRDRRGGSA